MKNKLSNRSSNGINDLLLSPGKNLQEAEIVDISPDASRLFNYSRKQLGKKKFKQLLAPRQNNKNLRQLDEKIEQEGGYSGFLICRNQLGILFKVGWLFVKQGDGSGRLRGKILEIIRSNHRWSFDHYFEHYDFITGLPAPELLFKFLADRLNNYARYREQLAIITLDIDNFSRLNEENGIKFADEVLRITARRLLEKVKKLGMVARTGSDEFTIISSRLTGKKKLETFLRNVLHKISDPIHYNGKDMTISCSAGVVETIDEDATPRELIDQSFFALERVREAGGDSYRYFFPTDSLPVR